MMRSAVGGQPCGVCAGTIYGESSLHNYGSQKSFPVDFHIPCCTKFSRSTCCSENCAPDGCQSICHQNTQQSAWSQHCNFCMVTATSFWTGSSQVRKRDFTLTSGTKQQSMHWRHSGSSCKTKFKQNLSARKMMCTVFWDRRGILIVDLLTRRKTMNAERYCETVQKLRLAIQNKRHGLLSGGVVLLHDNARPLTVRRSTHLLKEFSWEVFNHPPYSPDLAPSNFHLFLHDTYCICSNKVFH